MRGGMTEADFEEGEILEINRPDRGPRTTAHGH